MPVSRREARELMSLGYELGATVLMGVLQRRADGTWWIGDRALEDVLAELGRPRSDARRRRARAGAGAGTGLSRVWHRVPGPRLPPLPRDPQAPARLVVR